jgi:hypothetical protein
MNEPAGGTPAADMKPLALPFDVAKVSVRDTALQNGLATPPKHQMPRVIERLRDCFYKGFQYVHLIQHGHGYSHEMAMVLFIMMFMIKRLASSAEHLCRRQLQALLPTQAF